MSPQQIMTQPCNLETNSYGNITGQLKSSAPKLAIQHLDLVFTKYYFRGVWETQARGE